MSEAGMRAAEYPGEPVTIADALSTLTDAVKRRDASQAEVDQEVELARLVGASWAQIGGRLGTTKQGAVKRYGVRVAAAQRLLATREQLDRAAPSSPVASPAVDVPLDLDPAEGSSAT